MDKLIEEELKLINEGDQESYDEGKEFGYNMGRILKAIGHIIDTFK